MVKMVLVAVVVAVKLTTSWSRKPIVETQSVFLWLYEAGAGTGVMGWCPEGFSLVPPVLVCLCIHKLVKKAADYVVMILYVEMAVFKQERSRIAARFLTQSGFVALMLKDIELVKQQTTKGRSWRNDRPFGILVPRRVLGHTGATPVGLACPTFLVPTSGAQAPVFLGWNEKSRPSCDDRLFGILVPRRGLEPPHPKAHGPEPCASTNSATWAYRCMLMVVPKAF